MLVTFLFGPTSACTFSVISEYNHWSLKKGTVKIQIISKERWALFIEILKFLIVGFFESFILEHVKRTIDDPFCVFLFIQ